MTKKKAAAKIEIVYRGVDTLVPDPNNARRHPPEQIERLRASIRRYGFTKPVALKGDGKTIGAGNGAWEAAKAEGLKDIPTITLRLSDAEWTAYAIADNKLPFGAEWNMDVLTTSLASLHGLGFNLGDLGFGDLELGNMGVPGFELEKRLELAEETPDPPKVPVVKRGELWLLGPHRLFCGDSTSAKDVAVALGDLKPVLLTSDPPYGVNYDPSWRAKAGVNKNKEKMGKVSNDDRADWTPAWELFPGDVAYVWHGGLHSSVVEASLKAAGFDIRSQIIWAKDRFALSRGDYHWRHEPAWYAVRKGKTGHWASDRKQDTVWNIPSRDDGGHGHGTQKPIECMRRPIINNSKKGDVIFDPFLGSGTSLIAAHMEGRVCVGLEIDPSYVEVIIDRFEKYSASTAKREDGKTLTDLRESARAGSRRSGSMKGSRAHSGG